MKISALGWLGLVLALCVSTFGASCVIAIVLGFIAFIIGLLTLLYVQSGDFEDTYFSCNLLNNPLAVQEIPAGGLPKIVESIKKPKPTQKTDQRVTGSDLIDSSLQEIFGYIIRDYVLPWYNLISTDTEFIELGVRKSAQSLAIHVSNRVKEIDWLPYLTTRLVDDAASQIRLFRLARQQSPKPCTPRHRRNKSDTDLSSSDDIDHRFFSFESDEVCGPGRCAVCTDTAREAEFLSSLAELLLYVLLPDDDFKCRPLRALLSQLGARCLLRPLADLTTDPDVVNGGILWLCNRDGTLNSETFLTVLRLTEDLGELRHTRDIVARELQQLRGRDSDAADSTIKQQLSSLQYVQSLIDSRLVVLSGQTHLQVQTSNFTPSVHLSLDTLLKNNVALSYFIDYATTQGQQSELFFYLAAEGWRISAEQQLASIALGETIDITPLKDSAKRLCSQYLNELTAPIHLLKNTRDLVYSNTEPNEKWFDELQKHVLEQLRILVPDFQRSASYNKLLADLDLVQQPTNPTRPSKHVRSLSDITCNTSTDLQTSFAQNLTAEYNQEEDYSKLKVGNFTLSIDIIEAGVMSEKGKTFGIYATQVSKLYDSGFLEQWHIYRRYSDFHELHTRIRERWTDLARLSFPGKKPFQTAERALLERRMRALNLYLSALCRPQMLDTHPGLKSVLASFTEHDIAQIQTTIPPPTSQEDNNIPLRVLLTLADEVFDLRSRNQWLRRRLVTLLRQIIRAWFGDIVSRRIVDYVATSTSPRAVARSLKSLQRTVWPGGVRAPTKPRRSAPVRARTRLAARVALLGAPALGEEVPRLLGQDTTRKGLLGVCELVQRPVLTRRLLYVILEGVLSHLMPEKPIGKIFGKLYQAAATNPT